MLEKKHEKSLEPATIFAPVFPDDMSFLYLRKLKLEFSVDWLERGLCGL